MTVARVDTRAQCWRDGPGLSRAVFSLVLAAGLAAALGLPGPAGRAAAADANWGIDSVGVYGGAEPEGDEEYSQVEALLNVSTPFAWGPDDGFQLATQIQVGGGAVWTDDDTAFVGGAGPRFVLRYGSLPLWLEIGSRAGIITENRWGGDDLGGGFQFTSHAAIGVELSRVRIGLRMQHTSNAGIYDENDGYNILGGVIEFGF